jgi:hypothetical protein
MDRGVWADMNKKQSKKKSYGTWKVYNSNTFEY